MNLAWMSALNGLRSHRRHDRSSIDATTDDNENSLAERIPGQLPAPDHVQDMGRAWALSVVHQGFDEVKNWSQNEVVEPETFTIL